MERVTQPAKKKRLEAQIPKQGVGKGVRTRGWAAEAPSRGRQRSELKEKCGSKCFLKSDTMAFPICPKCYNAICDCQIDCRGLTAAKARARQFGYTDVTEAIAKLEQRGVCKTSSIATSRRHRY